MAALQFIGGGFMFLGVVLFLGGRTPVAVFFGMGCLALGLLAIIGAMLVGGQRQHHRRTRRRYDDYDDEPRRLPRKKAKKRITYEVIEESSDEHEAEVEVRDVPRQLPSIKRKPIHMRKR